MIAPRSTLPLLLALLLPPLVAGQEARTLAEGLRSARGKQGVVALCFGIPGCASTRAFEREVLGPRLARELPRPVVVVRSGLQMRTPAERMLHARARVRVLPTLCLLDEAGWPLCRVEGYRSGQQARVFERLQQACEQADEVQRLRACHREGCCELAERYTTCSDPWGRSLAVDALWGGACEKVRARWAPHRIPHRLAAGRPVENELALCRCDPERTREALHLAGVWATRLGRSQEGLSWLEELLRGADVPREVALDAHLWAARAARALQRAETARRHERGALALLGPTESPNLRRVLEARLGKR